MSESLRLGRVAGVPVGAHWSLAVVFAMLTVGLAAGRLLDRHPEQSTAAYVTVALVVASLYVCSLLAHELAHATVARFSGIGVDGIVLWAVGGVARLDRRPDTPAAQLRIAVAGPCTSVLLGVLFGALSVVPAGSGIGVLAAEGAWWLALINLVLAAVNLLPGAPPDGGRALHAVLWHLTGDRDGSAESAAGVGRVLGYVLVTVGVVQFAAFGSPGLWLVLIGWFLAGAARVEGAAARARGSLGELRIGELMSADPITVDGDLPVELFVDGWIMQHPYEGYPVARNGGEPVGLVTIGQVKDLGGDFRGPITVASIATPLADVPVARVGERVVDVLGRLAGGLDDSSARRVLVLDADSRLVGIVSPSDVLGALQRRSPPRGREPVAARREPRQVAE